MEKIKYIYGFFIFKLSFWNVETLYYNSAELLCLVTLRVKNWRLSTVVRRKNWLIFTDIKYETEQLAEENSSEQESLARIFKDRKTSEDELERVENLIQIEQNQTQHLLKLGNLTKNTTKGFSEAL